MALLGSRVFRYKVVMDFVSTQTRLQVIFTGRVQGVGFRYTVCRLAKLFKVVGFVRNLPTGHVEVTAEGEKPELTDFYNKIRNSSIARYVINEQVQWLSSTGEFDQFRILYS